MTKLILKDDIDEVVFETEGGTGGIYYLIDGTFSAPPPEVVDIRSSVNPNRIVSQRYTNRTISFSYMVRENREIETINKSIGRLYRMFERASSKTYLDGDSYQQNFTFDNGETTGDNGLILQLLTGEAPTVRTVTQVGGQDVVTYNPRKYETEEGVANTEDPGLYTFKVIVGRQEIVSPLSIASNLDGNERFVMRIDVELECEPYALGPSMMIHYQSTGLPIPPSSHTGSAANKIIISGDKIPGDAPALTRITTRLQSATGIIMGRHAGDSCLLNCPTVPVQISGNGKSDLIVGGVLNASGRSTYRIRIDSTNVNGDSVSYSLDNGSTWSTPITLQDHTAYDIGSTGLWFMFLSRSGHTQGNQWQFRTTQSYLVPRLGSSRDLTPSNVYLAFMSEDGFNFDDFEINVPKEARGRYRIMAEVTHSGIGRADIRAVLSYKGFDGLDGSPKWTKGSYFDWVRTGVARTIVDLGVLDLTPSGLPHRSHPGSSGMIRVELYARGSLTSKPPDTSMNVRLIRAFIVPVQDEDSFLWAGWSYDGIGREVYSNYDYSNPYIGEVSASVSDKKGTPIYSNSGDVKLGTAMSVGLDETHIGAPITLIPGVTNTILMAPTVTGWPGIEYSDFRASYFDDSGNTGEVSISIRPRYLFVGW